MEKIKYLRYSCKVKMDQEASQPTEEKARKKQTRTLCFFKMDFQLQTAVESHYLRIL